MLCDKCKKNPAKIFLTKIDAGSTNKYNLCEECAAELASEMNPTKFLFNLPQLVAEMFGISIANISENPLEDLLTCSECGYSYKDFKSTGVLGCSRCYESFSDQIEPIIKSMQNSYEHTGRAIKKDESKITHAMEIAKLKKQLQEHVLLEQYEEAAVVRDQIRALEKKMTANSHQKEDKR